MWRSRARLRFTLPVPVTLKRFLALEWVFIFGITKMMSVKKMERKGSTLAQSAQEKFKIVRKSCKSLPFFSLRGTAAGFLRCEDDVHTFAFHAGELFRSAVFFQFFQKTQ